jgi:hypothetical protein
MADWSGVLPDKKEFTIEMNIDNFGTVGLKFIKELEEARNKHNYL